MGLPVFDGVQEALEHDNEARKKDLERAKASPAEKNRVASKRKRAYEGKKRQEWSKKHGHHTYYGGPEEHVEKGKKTRAANAKKGRASNLKKCPVKRKRGTYSDLSDNILLLDDSDSIPTDSGDNEIREPPEKKTNSSLPEPIFEVGDYVCVHKDKYHIVCRIVGEFHGRYSLYCPAGVINRSFCATELMQIDNFTHIPLNEWRQAPKVPLSDTVALALVSECTCSLPACLETVIAVSSAEDEQEKDEMWVKV